MVGKEGNRAYIWAAGTGKSTMIRPTDNFLDYEVYGNHLTSAKNNTDCRSSSTDKSRTHYQAQGQEGSPMATKINDDNHTLADRLHQRAVVDVQRILVFMTTLFDRLDLALIRPGKTGKHMEMSCCWLVRFMVLAK
uniref:Uncharacterized protein n=1 Tax=Oryza rufipogon TaxID=4529 RepID=A0A0E0RH68_ORYRU